MRASHIPTDLNHNPAAKAIFTGKMRDAINGFFEYLNKYIKSQNLEKCLDHKTLCDDMYIAIQTFGTKLGHYIQILVVSHKKQVQHMQFQIFRQQSLLHQAVMQFMEPQRQNATDGLSLPPAPYKISRQKSSSTPGSKKFNETNKCRYWSRIR